MVSGGNSLIRYLLIGQLMPQPTEVMARNIRPAGAIRAPPRKSVDSVMRQFDRWDSSPPWRLSRLKATGRPGPAGAASLTSGESVRCKPSATINSWPVNNGRSLKRGGRKQFFSLGNPCGLTDTCDQSRRGVGPLFLIDFHHI